MPTVVLRQHISFLFFWVGHWCGTFVCHTTQISDSYPHMASGAAFAADGLFRCVFDGCIAGCDTIERRPYHRNCSCALHKSRQQCGHAWPKTKKVSYPMRRAWSEGCLSLHAVASANSSPSSSPHAVVGKTNTTHHLGLCEEEDDHSSIFVKL